MSAIPKTPPRLAGEVGMGGESRQLHALTDSPHPSPPPQVGRENKKRVTLLGATGTIGQNTLSIIEAHPQRFLIEAMTAGDNVAELARLARKFKPRRTVIANEKHYGELKAALAGTGIEVAAGADAVCEAAAAPADIVMSAIVGSAGLKPTLAGIRSGKTIALANKECLVCAGNLMNKEVQKYGAKLIPVDSEHNAIFQLLSPLPNPPPQAGEGIISYVESLTLTASGGPFRKFTLEQMKNITPEQAIKHPNWNMGAKISVDSATLMNKGLEMIEAFYLFPLKPEQIKAIIHPQSIMHCLVSMIDGSVLAQMSHPDMRIPIAYALAWPERISAPVKKLDFADMGTLEFEAVDQLRFPALRLAKQALIDGGNAPTVLSGANEIAVARFLKGEIGFLDIAKLVDRCLEMTDNVALRTIDDVMACDEAARRLAERL